MRIKLDFDFDNGTDTNAKELVESIEENDALYLRLKDNNVGIYLKQENEFVFLSDLGVDISKKFLPYLLRGDEIQGGVVEIYRKKNSNNIEIYANFDDPEEIPPDPVKTEKMLLAEISTKIDKERQDLHSIKNILVFFTILFIIGVFVQILTSCAG